MERPSASARTGKRPALPLTGGCPCGAVRYELGAYPLVLYACHCTDCQRQSGSAFAMSMSVATEAFSLTRGEVKGWRRPSPSGIETVSWFCADCAGRIYGSRAGGSRAGGSRAGGSRAGRPEAVNVRAGTLDDTSWLIPAGHIFMRSAQRWDRPSGADCFDASAPDYGAMARAWQALWR
jgi:hypothetical protein